jgi:hypothetical protein
MTHARFRLLLTLSLLASIASGLASDSFAARTFLEGCLRQQHAVEFLTQHEVWRVAGEVLLFAYAAALVGLWFLWRPARIMTAIVWAAYFVWFSFAGPILSSAMAIALSECSALLTGIVLALTYSAPVRDWFDGHLGRRQAA